MATMLLLNKVKVKNQSGGTPVDNKQVRIPPQAVDVENALLGTVLVTVEQSDIAYILSSLQPEDFYKPENRVAFRVMVEMYMNSEEIDAITFEQKINDTKDFPVKGTGYVYDLMDHYTATSKLDTYCAIVADKAIKRSLAVGLNKNFNLCYDNEKSSYDVLDSLEDVIQTVSSRNNRKSGRLLSDTVVDSVEKFETTRERGTGIVGIPSGMKDIDNILSGFQKGNLYIVAARPSMGKTALVLTIAKNMASHPGEDEACSAVFSMEMNDVSLTDRFFGIQGGVNIKSIQNGTLTEREQSKFYQAAGELQNLPIILDDTANLSNIQLKTKVKRYKNEYGLKAVFVDYLQLMNASDHKGNREQEISKISRGLKQIAMEEDIPVIALSQLSRAVEQRGGDKRPILSDLRESGSLEQDADVVIFLYRPEYYKITVDDDGQSTKGIAEVIVAKQRNGPIGTAKLLFEEETTRFKDLEWRQPASEEFVRPPTPYKDDDDDYAPF